MSLIAENLVTGYGDKIIATDVNLSLAPGLLTVLIGANGSGKSTLLRTLTGAQPALGGTVKLDGKNVFEYRPAELARKLSLVLTDRTGGGGLTVAELVGIGRHPYSGFFGRMSAANRRVVAEAVDAVGLGRKAGAFVASLSDGERQKAMIARAIAQATDIVVLDEPTSFLDVSSRFEIMDLLGSMSRENGKTVLLSTHDIAPALAVANCVWALGKDRVYDGTVAELSASGALDSIYPGVTFDPFSGDYRRRLS